MTTFDGIFFILFSGTLVAFITITINEARDEIITEIRKLKDDK